MPFMLLYKLVHVPRIMKVLFFSETRFSSNLKGRYQHLIFYDQIKVFQKSIINENISVWYMKDLMNKTLVLLYTLKCLVNNTLTKIRWKHHSWKTLYFHNSRELNSLVQAHGRLVMALNVIKSCLYKFPCLIILLIQAHEWGIIFN